MFLSKILNSRYTQIDWTRQRLVFAAAALSGGLRQFSATPSDFSWRNASEAVYMSPVTYRKAPGRDVNMDSELVDTIPAFWCDIDWHNNEEKPYWGDVWLTLLDADIVPSLLVETPRGYHAWWFLENPLTMHGSVTSGVWKASAGAEKGLSWWRDISVALHRKLRASGLPADLSGAGSPAKLLRLPVDSNVRHWDEKNLWTLSAMDARVEPFKFSGRVPRRNGGVSKELEGVPEGARNTACWKLALSLVAEYSKSPSEGWDILSSWCKKCTPAYPESEALPVWRWALRIAAEGRLYAYVDGRPSERSRKEQGVYAAGKKKTHTDDAIEKAVEKMTEEGVPDPWDNVSLLAKTAGVSRNSVYARKRIRLLEKGDTSVVDATETGVKNVLSDVHVHALAQENVETEVHPERIFVPSDTFDVSGVEFSITASDSTMNASRKRRLFSLSRFLFQHDDYRCVHDAPGSPGGLARDGPFVR